MDLKIVGYLALGLSASVAFLYVAEQAGNRNSEAAFDVLRFGLIGAALIYVGFASLAKEWDWVLNVELGGVLLYGIFCILSKVHSKYWLAVGWAAHPFWDLFHLFDNGANFVPEW
eukprot:CAMPEP_0194050940 /NCGR_PEP_ID=MMETSP0009_2-20130614/37790_1 /TAXON_ID=210454 /ORGANISM="Grammatophora oceanica, Strain CCMP 410" /LENGTH=114 /DNA_ID=CAMNT_0038697813 /DNA_START=70 /DNA_END=411 /DNA_ORIENTATION=-